MTKLKLKSFAIVVTEAAAGNIFEAKITLAGAGPCGRRRVSTAAPVRHRVRADDVVDAGS